MRRCRGIRCSTCATTCTPSPFVVSLSKWVSRSYLLLEDSPADIVLAFKPGGDCDQTSAGPPSVLDLLPNRASLSAALLAFVPADFPRLRFFFFVFVTASPFVAPALAVAASPSSSSSSLRRCRVPLPPQE